MRIQAALRCLVTSLMTFDCTGCAHGGAHETRSVSGVGPTAELMEQVAIRELLDRSSDAINHQDWTALMAMFTEDAVWERRPPTAWRIEGREAIRAFLARNSDKVDVVSYTVSATAIHVQGPEHASARSTLVELLRFMDTGRGLRIIGTYTDEFVKKDGRWWFKHRTGHPRYEDEVPGPTRMLDGDASPASATESIRPPTPE
ncbi:nuclear transport factor 2 family protein [Archangium violaceum]|uniref:nuclear transport factor 2 family protein n=1 Tax=Archangium violaceum TaxID=83451 RepID=UPI00193AECDB|nr:nuclear transport factor 2 family protein [Archangium violaceum]QRK11519.1 nuclear transport factor 2 family protein [Archangium violaceum]